MSERRGRSAPYRGVPAEGFRWFCWCFLTLAGWKIRGDWPALRKAVLVAAPHTSNWDGLYMLAAAGYFRITLQWMGKASLTQGPFGWLVRALGCIPVDRSGSHDLVQAMQTAFAARDDLLLAVPPEGTRARTKVWKSGFYHIACQARVPIILSVLDYGSGTIRIAGVFHPTGDYGTDIDTIQSYYHGAVGKHAAQFSAGG